MLLFEENFEAAGDSPNVLLSEFSPPSGVTYTADPYWLSRAACNGFIMSFTSTRAAADCTDAADADNAFDDLTALTSALGALPGSGGSETNNAVASYSSSNGPNNAEMFRTEENIDLGVADRFVGFSVDAAAAFCGFAQPQLQFSIIDGAVESPLTGVPINPCTAEEATTESVNTASGESLTVSSGTFLADGARLMTNDAVGIVMRNATGSSTGNDGAYDNIRVFDITPQLDKAFSPTSVPVGGTSTLTLTVTNTAELAAKVGWGFVDTLPDGLVVADDPALGGSCTATTTADPGGSVITVSDGALAEGEVSCTITVDVTSDTPVGADPSPKTYLNCPENFSELVGIDLPACAEVEFYSERELVVEKSSEISEDSRPGDVVPYAVTVTNTGTADYTVEEPAVVRDDLSGVLDDAVYNGDAASDLPGVITFVDPILSWEGALPAGESVVITYTVTLVGGGDGEVRNVAWIPVDPQVPGVTPECDPPDENGQDPQTGEPCAEVEELLPRLEVSKVVDTTTLPEVGAEVVYTVEVTNVGPGVYTDTAPASMTDDLSDVLDDATLDPATITASVGTAGLTGTVLSWSGPLGVDETATITYTVVYTGEGDQVLRNQACVPQEEVVEPGTECSETQVPGPVLESWKQAVPLSDPLVAGSTVEYTLFFENSGEGPATVDAVDDISQVLDDAELTQGPTADGGLDVVVDGEQLLITGSVAPGTTATVQYTVTIRPDGERGDDIAANFLLPGDGEPPTGPECEPVDPERPDCTTNPIASLEYAKDVEASETPVGAGTELVYTITLTSTGQAPTDVDLVDDLSGVLDDADLTSPPASDTPSVEVSAVADGAFSMTGVLEPGETATITYAVTVRPESERGDNQADNFVVPPGVTPPTECLEGAPDCTTTPLPLIDVVKDVDPEEGTVVAPGEEVTYTLTFTNSGGADGEVAYFDDLTAVLDDAEISSEPVSSDPSVEVSEIVDGVFTVSGTLGPGEVVTVTYGVTVLPLAEGGDGLLTNFVVRGDETTPPECVDGDPLCTVNPTPEPPGPTPEVPDPAPETVPPPGTELPRTGGDVAAMTLAVVSLLFSGTILTAVVRRRLM